MSVELHPIGATLAVLFVVCMSSLFVWMFRVPPVLPRPVVAVTRTVAALRRILVPVVETVPAERAVELACRLGKEQKAEIILVHVVVVPLTLPLGAWTSWQEKVARQALETAEALVRRHNLPVRSRIVPDRSAAGGILRLARDEDVNVIVMGMGAKRRPGVEHLGQIATEVLRRAGCEVIVDKAPIQE